MARSAARRSPPGRIVGVGPELDELDEELDEEEPEEDELELDEEDEDELELVWLDELELGGLKLGLKLIICSRLAAGFGLKFPEKNLFDPDSDVIVSPSVYIWYNIYYGNGINSIWIYPSISPRYGITITGDTGSTFLKASATSATLSFIFCGFSLHISSFTTIILVGIFISYIKYAVFYIRQKYCFAKYKTRSTKMSMKRKLTFGAALIAGIVMFVATNSSGQVGVNVNVGRIGVGVNVGTPAYTPVYYSSVYYPQIYYPPVYYSPVYYTPVYCPPTYYPHYYPQLYPYRYTPIYCAPYRYDTRRYDRHR